MKEKIIETLVEYTTEAFSVKPIVDDSSSGYEIFLTSESDYQSMYENARFPTSYRIIYTVVSNDFLETFIK